MIRVYTELELGNWWLHRYRGQQPVFACVLGFTDTGLIPGISAAGATPDDRRYTAIADAEFLANGPQPQPRYPLPPLNAGASPVLISRAVVHAQNIPVYLFNAGLPQPPSVPAIDLGGAPARCLSTGDALDVATVKHLLDAGFNWGQQLAIADGYLIIGECVVGGTTTALAILTGLGVAAAGKVNSSHPTCNHAQKLAIAQAGLQRAGLGTLAVGAGSPSPEQGSRGAGEQESGGAREHPHCPPAPLPLLPSPLGRGLRVRGTSEELHLCPSIDPLQLVAAVGDPMQVAAAGMAIAASRTGGVLLAGGTQMLAVYALICAIAHRYSLPWRPEHIVVGTTRWVAEDPTGDTVGLAKNVGSVAGGVSPSLLATQLSFATSRYPMLRAYESGYVKEGMGAGGCAIAAHLYRGWNQTQLLQAIEAIADPLPAS